MHHDSAAIKGHVEPRCYNSCKEKVTEQKWLEIMKNVHATLFRTIKVDAAEHQNAQ